MAEGDLSSVDQQVMQWATQHGYTKEQVEADWWHFRDLFDRAWRVAQSAKVKGRRAAIRPTYRS